MDDLLCRVCRELNRVRLPEVGGAAHGAPFAVPGEQLPVETNGAFDSVHSERQVCGDVAALGDPKEDLGRACWATSLSGAFWQMATPGPEIAALYPSDPRLSHAVVDIEARVGRLLTAVLQGLLTQPEPEELDR